MVEPETGITTQLTFATQGDSSHPSITDDGAFVYFKSDAPFFDPEPLLDAYRVETATGTIERVGGLAVGGLGSGSYRWDLSIYADGDGDRAVFTALGDHDGENPDGSSEVWIVDFTARKMIVVGRDTPTVISWTAEPGPARYDVIRGDVAELRPGVEETVDLGPVLCVENDSADNSTAGDEDPGAPLPGQSFFYLRRGTPGGSSGPGSWGQGTGGKQRVAGVGTCDP